MRGFFKNRGYENAGDLTKHQIAELPAGPSLKTFSYEEKQIFDKPDTAKLQNEKVLNEAGKYLKQTKFGLVVVASSAGMVVRDYLVKNFKLDDTRVKTIGLGKADTAKGERKVDILVYPVGINAPPAQRKAAGSL